MPDFRPRGVFAAALTPLKSDGTLDLDSVLPYLEFLAGRGCAGALLFGGVPDPGEAGKYTIQLKLRAGSESKLDARYELPAAWSATRLDTTFAPGLSAPLIAPADTNLANVSMGLRWHLSDRFIVRADYTLHTAYLDKRRTGEYRALTGGLSFFF